MGKILVEAILKYFLTFFCEKDVPHPHLRSLIYRRYTDLMPRSLLRKVYALLNTLGITTKADRIQLVNELLHINVSSFTELTDGDLSELIPMMENWQTIQDIRFASGALYVEHCALNTLLYGGFPSTYPPYHSSFQRLLPQPVRKQLMANTKKLIADNHAASFEELSEAISKMSGASLAPRSEQEVPDVQGDYHFGRLPASECVKSAVPSLGVALQTGGLPIDSVIHVWGEKGCGKTTWVLNEAAAQQRQGRQVVYINAETAYNASYFYNLGVDLEKLLVVNVDSLESCGDVIKTFADSGAFIIVDSIAALQSKRDVERDLQKTSAGYGSAQLWTSIINSFRTKSKGTTLVLINQVRSKVEKTAWEDPLKPYGANAIQHATDVSLRFRAAKAKESATSELGMQALNIRFDKNRWSDTTGKVVSVYYRPGFPFSKSKNLLDLADENIMFSDVKRGVASQTIYVNKKVSDDGSLASSSNWFSFNCFLPEARAAIAADEFVDYDPMVQKVALIKALLDEDENVDADEAQQRELIHAAFPDIDEATCDAAMSGVFSGCDDPDVVKTMNNFLDKYTGFYSVRFMKSAMKWLQTHPTYMDMVEERLLDTINLDYEKLSEQANDFA